MAALSRKEYLKRYLSSNDKKKKKKATKPTSEASFRCKIVDDDVDLSHLPTNQDADHEPERGEDAPLVAEVIDERPAELRVEEEYRKNSKWKTLGADSDSGDEKKTLLRGSDSDSSQPRGRRHHSDSDPSPGRKQRHDSDSDQSPIRTQRHDSDSDQSPNRIQKLDSRAEQSGSHSRDQRHSSHTAQSPARKQRHNSGSDQSPPRKRRHDSGSDQSPPRRRKQDSDGDQTPPRKKSHNSNSQTSPPRRKRHNSDQSPPRRKGHKTSPSPVLKRNVSPDSDQSPPRKGEALSSTKKDKRQQRRDQSPPRKGKSRWGPNESPPPSKKSKRTESPLQSHSKDSKRTSDDRKEPERMLEGKRAGLQEGKNLRKESEGIRRREMEAFKNIDDEMSGRTAATIIRDRKTGLKRNLKAEHLQQKAEEAKKVEQEEKYMKWGKGLKQQEMQEGRLANDMYEMTKPLARYKDDVDLDRELRQQDRDGDPMLAFIKKKKESASDPNKPVYRGPPPPPNRYGIPPGYRWDGVDRSNGFEAERIARAAEKKASLEDAYKWSVECM